MKFLQIDEETTQVFEIPNWVFSFLEKTFFGTCLVHEARKNELNNYCIDCDSLACEFCLSSNAHCHHKTLQIYRHIHKDVVTLSEIQKYIDSSKIQPYICNGQKVLALNPLPHKNGKQQRTNELCKICQRYIAKPNLYDYCSIACKVSSDLNTLQLVAPIVIAIAVSQKTSSSDPPFLLLKSQRRALSGYEENETPQELSKSSSEEGKEDEASESKRRRKRKGVPCRAPFF
ncbi:PLATZ transcription factor [Dillenia turbinata]|uniref:PLATZ transcription factor n=1 Tax=Dillenia turbinata TaxID=194707 RepID=A0AAN8ZBM6_9MAGN